MATDQSGSPSAPSSARGAKRVLLVEDNADLRETMALLLELEGHRVTVAANGLSAVESARAEHPDVALIDIGLPDIDGYEVARRLRQELGLTSTVLVALTGYAGEEHRERAMSAGFRDHLAKPVQLEDLQRVLGA